MKQHHVVFPAYAGMIRRIWSRTRRLRVSVFPAYAGMIRSVPVQMPPRQLRVFPAYAGMIRCPCQI